MNTVTELTVEIISREIIKPSSPTPPHLRTFNLSLLDQLNPSIYIPIVLLYRNEQVDGTPQKSNRLKKSLSETLTRFYPLAGRIRENKLIDCNDEGAYFLEARTDCQLSDVLQKPSVESLHCFLPDVSYNRGFTLLVQFTMFSCGGIAIGLKVSHKSMDASSLSTFLKSWVDSARESREPTRPDLVSGSLLPPVDMLQGPPSRLTKDKCIAKRYVFKGAKMASLKAHVAGGSGLSPTRVEAVLSFILKCITTASELRYGLPRPALLIQSVNLRRRTIPPLSKNAVGNLGWYFPVVMDGTETELHDLVDKLRNGLKEFCDSTIDKLKGDEGAAFLLHSIGPARKLSGATHVDSYYCTSWSGVPMYETDFGWGKPMWICVADMVYKNTILLMDTKCGKGIEAWVCLEVEDMAVFEQNEELMAFAAANPSALFDQGT